MHELSIAGSVVEIACRNAQGRRISRVRLKVGHLRQIVPASLIFNFELVARGTPAEGAELVLEAVPAIGACAACGAETEQCAFPLQCQACGTWNPRIVAGDELIVESLELEEAGIGAAT
ncbi:MAG: hydrogenase maturation nickel metallochaperone HypA [Chloroflexota bacterium]